MHGGSIGFAPAGVFALFIAIWLAVNLLLGVLSGWSGLQRRYPATSERPLVTLHMRSGFMRGVSMRGCLTLSRCGSGLRVAIWPIFGLFQRPFQVPWNEIAAETRTLFFMPMVKLRFGRPEVGSLSLDATTWEKLSRGVQTASQGTLAPVSNRTLAVRLALQWAALTALMGTFFYVAPRLQGWRGGLPLVVCYAFPAVVLGLSQLVRYARDRRAPES